MSSEKPENYDKTKINELFDSLLEEMSSYRKSNDKLRNLTAEYYIGQIQNRIKETKYPAGILHTILELLDNNDSGTCSQCGHKWHYLR